MDPRLRLLAVAALTFPFFAQFTTNGEGAALVSQAADGGVFVLLALGLNVVVGFAGLLDLGYAAFFATGAYTYALLASGQLASSPLHHAVHLPFWLLLFVAMFVAAGVGGILGAPTLRLRGDYLAIVTLGFGEIVPRIFKNSDLWTRGVNGIAAVDPPSLPLWLQGPWSNQPFAVVHRVPITDPMALYGLMLLLVAVSVVLVRNLQQSRLGRAWVAVREDEGAAAAAGVNTFAVKLLAFGIGAAFSGLAGAYYGAKLSYVSPDNFSFVVSVTVLMMVVLGGIGTIPGVIVGALAVYYLLFNILTNLPQWAVAVAAGLGLGALNQPHGDWPGLQAEVQRLNFLVFGVILVGVMLLRPQGLVPSRAGMELQPADAVEEEPVARQQRA